MKKIISILLAVMLVVSVATVSMGAIEYNPSDSYTVSKDTPRSMIAAPRNTHRLS